MSLAAHGRPRDTQDLDVLVDPTLANARRVAAAIADFGFNDTARDCRWFAEPYHLTMLGRMPQRIDVLTSKRASPARRRKRSGGQGAVATRAGGRSRSRRRR